MATPPTQRYSFADVVAAISGPGGAVNIGAGASVDESGGIAIAPLGAKSEMTVGADGAVVHALYADDAGTVTVTLLQTSPTNALLMQLYKAQTRSATTHGYNTITIRDNASGASITAEDCAFAQAPTQTFARGLNSIEWTFNCAKISQDGGMVGGEGVSIGGMLDVTTGFIG